MNERHPWKKGFTIGSIIVGVIAAIAGFSAISADSGYAGAGFLAALAGGIVIWGAIWLLRKSDSFKKWSTLSGGQRALGTLIMFPGFYAGIAVIVVIIAAGGELGRRN